MKDIKFSIIANMRTYCLEFRERNYPAFEGFYNVYVCVFGQLSGDYIGTIETPLAMNVDSSIDTNKLIESANELIYSNHKTSKF